MTPLDPFPDTVAPVHPNDDKNRRYTPAAFMEWIKAKARVAEFDLDPAADEESHHAPRWFSVQPYSGSAGVDGLAQSWLPHEALHWWGKPSREPSWRIFCNPPFDDLGAWVAKAWEACGAADRWDRSLIIAFVLPGNRHEQPFWQDHVEPFRDGRATRFGYRLDCHFPPGRQAYARPGSNGAPVGSADFPSCLLVWRRS